MSLSLGTLRHPDGNTELPLFCVTEKVRSKSVEPASRKMYLRAKGNMYKNKNVLIESIHKDKADKKREGELEAQREARRAKNAVRKEKRSTRKAAQQEGIETATKQ